MRTCRRVFLNEPANMEHIWWKRCAPSPCLLQAAAVRISSTYTSPPRSPSWTSSLASATSVVPCTMSTRTRFALSKPASPGPPLHRSSLLASVSSGYSAFSSASACLSNPAAALTASTSSAGVCSSMAAAAASLSSFSTASSASSTASGALDPAVASARCCASVRVVPLDGSSPHGQTALMSRCICFRNASSRSCPGMAPCVAKRSLSFAEPVTPSNVSRANLARGGRRFLSTARLIFASMAASSASSSMKSGGKNLFLPCSPSFRTDARAL